ncbi:MULTISPECIES: sensor histidine kinase [unclassified Kribbella]|uniref:sensor histidine kinase n=1 Tax=unclassified Kribbella TaxID=2644121 RepID=UPI003077667F
MGGRSRRPVPAVLFGATVIAEIAAVALSWRLEPVYETFVYGVFAVASVGAGALIAYRRPENPIGWLFCGFGVLNAFSADLAEGWGLRAAAEGWPGGPMAEWIASVSWLPSGYGWALTFLLFPTGRLPGPRWRPVPWIGAAGLVLAMVGWSLNPDRGREFAGGRNPVAAESLPTGALFATGMPLFLGALIAGALSLIVRFRRSSDLERQQLKWFAFAASVAGVGLPLSFALWYVTPLADLIAALALVGLPLAAAAAILRYRLYDIDLFISRTVAYATLTVLLGAAYVVLIIALGTLFGQGSAWATAAATVVCAILFRPLRSRVQDAVDRRFNRSRYDALHRMSAFLDDVRSGRRAPEDVQTVLREIFADPGLELLVYLPESRRYVDLVGNTRSGDDRHRIAIERGDQPIGVVLHDSTAELSPELLRRVVEDGGLAVEIARLRAELRLQLSEVKASRARIVAAGHAERRRIERDLHDGAQQRLVSIGLALRHAQHQLGSAPAAAGATLDGAVAEVSVAIGELRELARGLPPTQLDAGLAPAFHDLARRAPLPVSVDVPEERFDSGIEAAAYFICCEGLTNAVKHANATRVDLTARREHQSLLVTVADDGVGGASVGYSTGLTGLADRVAALGGIFRIDSEPGHGTTLTAELPCGS